MLVCRGPHRSADDRSQPDPAVMRALELSWKRRALKAETGHRDRRVASTSYQRRSVPRPGFLTWISWRGCGALCRIQRRYFIEITQAADANTIVGALESSGVLFRINLESPRHTP